MCHCELNVKILVRIWNVLPLSISCDWQVLLNSYLWICIKIWKKNYCFCLIAYFIYIYILYIIYWIQIQLQCIIQIQWEVDFWNLHSISIFFIRLFLDNDYGTIILQASFKLVLPNISLNMNVLKIISHWICVKNYKWCVMMDTLLIVVK
jgi:hypothetical protein